ncbi:MAG: sialate O-acetylesterase [Nevskiales bacterium]
MKSKLKTVITTPARVGIIKKLLRPCVSLFGILGTLTLFSVLTWHAPAFAAEVRVFVLAGQSNAVGFGSNASDLPPELSAPQNDVRFWFEEGPFDSVNNPSLRINSGGAFVPLQFQTDPSGATFGGLTSGFGPEIMLGRTLADSLEPEVAIVKLAINATSLATDWNPSTPGSLYDQLVDIVNAALAALTAAGDTGVVSGLFWMQGEWDAQNSADASAYQANLTNFIQRLRSDFPSPSLPFVFGRLNDRIDQSCCFSFPFLDTVRLAQEGVASTVANTAIVNTDDLPLNSDLVHFQADGQLSLGQRFATAFLGPAGTCGNGVIPITNPSFETPALADGVLAEGPGLIGGWNFSGTANTFVGIFNPPAGSYPTAGGNGTPTGAAGANAAFLFNNGGPTESVSATQTLTTTLTANTDYALTVGIGRFLPNQPFAFSLYGGYRIELLAGSTVIASDSDTAQPAEGAFSDATVAVAAGQISPALIGQPLAVRLAISSTEAQRSTHFDNIRLACDDVTDTAPPSTPTGLSATAISSSQINLTWTASTDNIGVAGYNIYRDGAATPIATVTSGTGFSNTGLSANTPYVYTVDAFDAAGNTSAQSASASATTLDSTPPLLSGGAPTGTLPAGTTSTTLRVTTDENATCKHGTLANTSFASLPMFFTTTGGTSHSTPLAGLSNGQTFTRYVRCQDASGNATTNDFVIAFSVAADTAPPAPDIGLTPASVNFGKIDFGQQSAVKTITVSSTGTATLAISALSLTGRNAGDFSIASDACSGTQLAPGASCVIGLRFRPALLRPGLLLLGLLQPDLLGTRNASLLINDNAADSPHSAALSGRGSVLGLP